MVAKRSLSSRESSSERPASRKGLQSLARPVSPPPAKKRKDGVQLQKSEAAAIEAGQKIVEDHLAFYSAHLLAAGRPNISGVPRIEHTDWTALYQKSAGSLKGCHFVVHQHDHPVAGIHYDLRLQCNPNSSISFAIMYGLPGDPNSSRLNRNATETRVHCLWNHLIETASHSTGSMLIWDTGEYEILRYSGERDVVETTDEDEGDQQSAHQSQMTEQAKLKKAFGERKIKLRLHGTRLPANYTLALRLTTDNNRTKQPARPFRRRKRLDRGNRRRAQLDSGTESEPEAGFQTPARRSLSSLSRLASPPLSPRLSVAQDEGAAEEAIESAVASDDENEAIRASNAYPGAVNDIGSIHQRKWYLSVDRHQSGFEKHSTKSSSGFTDSRWIRRIPDDALANGELTSATGFERFVVGGRETERSVVTGRLASEILADEGVVGYVPRGLWRAITE